jgi:hypothetical protein
MNGLGLWHAWWKKKNTLQNFDWETNGRDHLEVQGIDE